jgi:peptide/nickel transport system substrate-binding protein
MTLALEHDFLLKQVFFGIYRPGQGIFHPESWMAAKELQPFHRDVVRAEKLLEEAGWTDSDGDGVRDKKMDGRVVPFRFTLSCPNAGTGPRVAEQLQADLKSIGVECDIRLVEWVTFTRALTERKLDAYLMSMGTGVDPDTARNLWHSDAIEKGRNDVGYSNPRVDELLDRGRLELDRAKRAEIYAEVDRLIYRDQPITILLYQPTLWAFSKALRGYHPSPKGFYGYAPGFFAIWKKK